MGGLFCCMTRAARPLWVSYGMGRDAFGILSGMPRFRVYRQ